MSGSPGLAEGEDVAFADALVGHVVDALPKDVTLGEVFDAAESPRAVEAGPSGGLRLMVKGKCLAVGRLDSLADQPAFVVESSNP